MTPSRHQSLLLFVPYPHDAPEVCLAGKDDAGSRGGLNEELVTLDPVMAPLLGPVPLLVPGDLDGGDEITPFNAIAAAVGKHGLVERGASCFVRAALPAGRSRHNDATPFGCQNEITLRRCPKHVLGRAVLGDNLPRNQPPVANERVTLFRRRGRR